MTLKDLEIELVRMGVPSDMYCLSGGMPNESYVIGFNGDKWEFYYSERGSKVDLKTFDDESEACDFMLKAINEGGGDNSCA
jgi:hypothetical protein